MTCDVPRRQPADQDEEGEAEGARARVGEEDRPGGRGRDERGDGDEGAVCRRGQVDPGELDPLGGDGEDDEAGEQRNDHRGIHTHPEQRGERRQHRPEHLDHHRVVPAAAPQGDEHHHEGDAAVEQQHLADAARQAEGQGQAAEAEERGGGIPGRDPQGDRPLEGDEGAEEAEHHQRAVHLGEVTASRGAGASRRRSPASSPASRLNPAGSNSQARDGAGSSGTTTAGSGVSPATRSHSGPAKAIAAAGDAVLLAVDVGPQELLEVGEQVVRAGLDAIEQLAQGEVFAAEAVHVVGELEVLRQHGEQPGLLGHGVRVEQPSQDRGGSADACVVVGLG